MRKLVLPLAVAGALILSSVQAWADQKGTPVTLGRARSETVRSIMLRAQSDPQTFGGTSRTKTYEELNVRSNLNQPPNAIFASQWPPAPVSPVDRLKAGGLTEGDPKPSPAPLFSLGTSFPGIDSTTVGFRPPDTTGDVSPSTVLMAINGRIRSFDKTGAPGSLNATTNTFFASVRGGAGLSDPRVIFDKLTNRWFVAIITTTSTNNLILVAVSDGEAITPSTTWNFFSFNQNVGGGPSGFCDYPTLGVDANAVYIGSNRFGSAGGFNCDLFVVRKSSVLGTGPIVVTPFRALIGASSGMFTPWGCTSWDPSQTIGVVIGVDGRSWGRITLRRVTDPGGTPTLSGDLVVTSLNTNDPIDMPVNANPAVGSLDAIDDRLFYARIFEDRVSGRKTIWTAHNIGVDAAGISQANSANNDRTACRWYEFDNIFSGTPTVRQVGTVFDPAVTPNFFTIPSIAMNMQGHALIGGSYGNYANPAGVATAHRFSLDPLGTNTAATVRHPGFGTYLKDQTTATNQRWGDYSTTVVDPSDGMSIWTFQEYIQSTNVYGTRAVKMLAPAPTASMAPTDVMQGETRTITLSGTGIFDPGPGFPGRLAVSCGAGITVNSVNWISPTACSASITVGGMAALGNRNVVLTNPDGQSVTIANALNVTPSAKTVSGVLTLSNYVGPVGALPLTVEIRDVASNAVLQTENFAGLAAGNTYTFTTTLAPGTYKLRFKFDNRFLGKVETLNLGTGTNTVNSTLINGDVNGDNSVGTTDFNQLRAAFGSSSGGSADLNGDGNVGTIDFNILRASLGLSGQ